MYGLCEQEGALVLYVSTIGNDAWSGALPEPNGIGTDGPLASLAGARDRLRQLRTRGLLGAPVCVLFRQGVYRQVAPVEFAPEDSGSAEAPVTFGAYPNEYPVLSGGRELSGWQVSDGRWTLVLPEVKAGRWSFAALWLGGERKQRARSPNSGFFTTAGTADPPNQAFRFHAGDLKAWPDQDQAIVVAYHSWATSLHHILAVDPVKSIVRFTGPAEWPFENWGVGQRYRVENVFEALDSPGEWHLDRTTGVLSYLPLPGEDPVRSSFVAPVAGQLLVLRGDPASGAWVQYLKFQDLRFEHTDWQPGPQGASPGQAAVNLNGALELIGARHVVLERCFIGHVGTYGIWWRLGSQDGALRQCELTDLGGGGVRIGEEESAPTLDQEVQHIQVDNCFIHDTGKILAEGVGVWIGRSSYNQVTHNEICDLDYSGVSVGWSWGYEPSSANNNLVAHNHIHHLGRSQLSDMGGIYTLGISPGTQLLHNHIHDVFSYSYGGWGLYMDEGSSNILLSDNLVYSTKSGSFHQHYGQDNQAYNNILAYSHEGQIIRSREESHRSFDFQRNIVLFNNGWLLGGNWGNARFNMDNNLYWDTSGGAVQFTCQTLAQWQSLGFDIHSLAADPRFVDRSRLDFHLDPLSPVIALGFIPFGLDDFGLYGDPAWVDRPRQIQRPPTKLPSPSPAPWADNFEDTAVGWPPAGAVVYGETASSFIRVSDEQAYSGMHALKFLDAPGLDYVYSPHMFYQPRLRSGWVEGSFALRLGAGAIFYHGWRDGQVPYREGPSLFIDQDGSFSASNVSLPVTIPRDTWIRITIRFQLGLGGTGLYDLLVEIPGVESQVFTGLGVPGNALCALDWYGFVALSDARTVMFLDQVSLQPAPQRRTLRRRLTSHQ